MIFKARREYWFEPDIDDNLAQPSDRRVKALIIRPPAETKNELTELEIARDIQPDEISEARGKGSVKREERVATRKRVHFRSRVDKGRVLREFVPELKNVQVALEEHGETSTLNIKSGAELAQTTAYGVGRLIDALVAEVLREELPEETEKNSEPASSSS